VPLATSGQLSQDVSTVTTLWRYTNMLIISSAALPTRADCADCPCSASGARRSVERMPVWMNSVCALCIVGLPVGAKTHLLESDRFPVSTIITITIIIICSKL